MAPSSVEGGQICWSCLARAEQFGPVGQRIQRLLASTKTVVLLTVGGIVIGALASVWTNDLASKPPLTWLFSPDSKPRTYAAVVFWALLLLWAVLFYFHHRTITKRESDEARRLERLVVRAPQRSTFNDARTAATIGVAALGRARTSPGQERELAVSGIKDVLLEVVSFAKKFSGRIDARYGANLMIARSVTDLEDDPQLKSTLRFFDTQRELVTNLRAVLAMEERFLVEDPDVTENTTRHVPRICLPVPIEPYDERKRWLALPGAPMTFLTGQPSVHQDLEQFVADCKAFGDFKPSAIASMKSYFETEASSVRSFASYKIGHLAVLNIDCAERFLLGDEEEFIASFTALLLPTQLVLADLVALVYSQSTSTGGIHGPYKDA